MNTSTPAPLLLDYIYEHEVNYPERIYLTQPIGNGQVNDYTWAQTLDQARRMAAHLRSFNFAPGARIAILSKNCAHFIMAELAIWMAGGTTVAIFPTENADTVKYVLAHSDASLLFVGKLDTWENQVAGVPSGLPMIAFPLAPKTAIEGWDSIVGRTEPIDGRASRQGADIAMINYTSGSTGQPKGVMHNFERITAVVVLLSKDRELMGLGDENRMLSYLPLAHIFERAYVACFSLFDGNFHIFFAESLDTFAQDLQRARPTLFLSVPRLWIKFQQGVFAKIPPKKLDRLLSIPFLGKVVARKVLKGLGLDQTLFASSGSAPLPVDLIVWYRRLGLNLMEGYGMTEDFAYSYNSTADKCLPGYVGAPRDGVQVRLSEEGEILVKSPGQLVGYYKRPDLDAESFTADGFFKTGDLGSINSDGLLKITGRIKELFKTGKGKYVAPAPIENKLNAHPMIESSMVSGVGQSASYALIVLAEDVRPKLNDPATKAEVTAQMTTLLKETNKGLADYEHMKMIVIANETWSIDNGCLTPTMKIKRSRIEAKVAPLVDKWFEGKDVVLWS
jgi:long-chain acyl-CoA synthetase